MNLLGITSANNAVEVTTSTAGVTSARQVYKPHELLQIGVDDRWSFQPQ